MQAGKFIGRKITTPRKQRGVVLLIALIILIAMSLAGIGMMRSVDTGSVVAGNMAFKHAALNATDAGTSAGFNALASVANSGNDKDKPILNFSPNTGAPKACPGLATAAGCPGGVNINLPGYVSAPILQCEVTSACNSTWWTVDANWANAATITVADPNGGTIATVSYLIHRMCETPDMAPSGQRCQTYTQPATGCSKTQLLPCTSTSVFYRITSRSVGARNSVAYAQTLVLVAQ